MKAIEIFRKNAERALGLIELHESAFPRGRPRATGELPDMLRASVVFAVAAVDSYFHDKILENVIAVIKYCGKNRAGLPGYLSEILKDCLTPEKALSLLYRKRPDEEFRKVLARHLGDRTYQDAGKIEKAVQIIGVSDIWESVRQTLRLRSKNRAKAYIQPYVRRRHQIVHEGDLYKSKKFRHTLRPIARSYARNCVKHIRWFIEAVDKAVDRKFADKYGP